MPATGVLIQAHGQTNHLRLKGFDLSRFVVLGIRVLQLLQFLIQCSLLLHHCGVLLLHFPHLFLKSFAFFLCQHRSFFLRLSGALHGHNAWLFTPQNSVFFLDLCYGE